MDNQQEQKSIKKRKIIFATSAMLAIIMVVTIGYFTLKNLKSTPSLDEGASQEQFQTTPETSTALQSDCQKSAAKIASLKNIEEIETEFRTNAEVCREVYFSVEGESLFRKEGVYGDLSVDLAHYVLNENKSKAMEIFNFAKSLKPWEFYLGPVSCDSHHVLDAYIESANLTEEKKCIKLSEYKEKLLPDLQSKKFNILKQMLSKKDIVWMGQPESDVGCPEKISTVLEILNKLTSGEINIIESTQEAGDSTEILLSIKAKSEEKLALVFRPQEGCLELKSLLVTNIEAVE